MKARLQTSLGQNLVMTPQLRQAIRLLQMSTTELQMEITQAVESNPLLEWADELPQEDEDIMTPPEAEPAGESIDGDGDDAWSRDEPVWEGVGSGGSRNFDDADAADITERMTEPETLQNHLLWQLHLSHLSPVDLRIGTMLIDALDNDGYLREPLSAIAESLYPDIQAGEGEILTVLHHIQRFDPIGVGARDLNECLCLQLETLPENTPGRELALRIAKGPLEQLPRSGIKGIALELKRSPDDVEQAINLLRSLDPRPGKRIGELTSSDFVIPDCEIWREHGVWHVALSRHAMPRVGIHHGYEQLIRRCTEDDASYLRGQLQEARWLLKSLESRGETLLKVMRCLIREQAGFLEFGERALRPLTLRQVAAEISMHESTVSRAVAGKYVHTPRGTLPLKAFFASGVGSDTGSEASSTAIQSMIRRFIDEENPRKPLSDAKLSEMLKRDGLPVARRTVTKYREAMNIPASHERVRIS
jgi:RNA polymerase sigma-54 factor